MLRTIISNNCFSEVPDFPLGKIDDTLICFQNYETFESHQTIVTQPFIEGGGQ